MSKQCSRCRQTLPVSSFARNRARPDGYGSYCKECQAEYRNSRVKQCREYRRRWELRNPRKCTARQMRYAQRYPEKIKAKNLLGSALVCNRMQRLPCRDCSTTERVEAHHPDYTKPLDVIWLCPTHHRAEHVKCKEALKDD